MPKVIVQLIQVVRVRALEVVEQGVQELLNEEVVKNHLVTLDEDWNALLRRQQLPDSVLLIFIARENAWPAEPLKVQLPFVLELEDCGV